MELFHLVNNISSLPLTQHFLKTAAGCPAPDHDAAIAGGEVEQHSVRGREAGATTSLIFFQMYKDGTCKGHLIPV